MAPTDQLVGEEPRLRLRRLDLATVDGEAGVEAVIEEEVDTIRHLASVVAGIETHGGRSPARFDPARIGAVI